MTDQELIKALRDDAEWAHANEWETPITLGDNLDDAADRLEALLAEVTELKKNVAMLLAEKSEMGQHIRKLFCDKSNLDREVGRLEVERDHFRDFTKKLWCEKRYCKDTGVDASKVESFRCTGEKCPLELGNIRRCTMRNCPWRTMPSTEGVE